MLLVGGKQYACCVPYGYKSEGFQETMIVSASLKNMMNKAKHWRTIHRQ